MTIIRKALLDILDSQSFECLDLFKREDVWNDFVPEDRFLLARLLVMQGSQQLAVGSQQVLESFEMACKVSSDSPEILYHQGDVFATYQDNIRCLTLANQAFGRAVEQNPNLLKGWYQRAKVLTEIGIFEDDSLYFVEADQNFEKAQALFVLFDELIDKEEFYWRWGKCLASLGKVSGEPLDFHRAIEKFEVAYQLKNVNTVFLNDFGNSYVDLARLLDKSEYLVEALALFHEALLQDEADGEAWYNQACCMQKLIEFSSQDRLLEEADDSFARASMLTPNMSQLWFKWGQLDMIAGKLKHDSKKLETSLIKFAKAYELEPGYSHILSNWAEAELFLGSQEDRFDLLQSARAKIMHSLEIQPEDPEVWYLYGSCLNELGRYFIDEKYYHQAIEKFQYGLSLSRQQPLLWYGIALAYYSLGELTQQQAMFEKSVRYYSGVIESGSSGFAQFWNDWGLALMKLGDFTQQSSYVETALEKFELALKQPLQNIEGEDVDLEWVYNYGCAHDLLGDLKDDPCHFEKAVQILTQVLQLDSHYIQARYSLALSLAHLAEAMSDIELFYKSTEHFESLLQEHTEDDSIHLDFGVTLTHFALLIHDIHCPEASQVLYRQAENHLIQAVALGNTQGYYQLAGLYSITGHFDSSMRYLERAQSFDVLPGIDDLLHDEWLEGVRHISAFKQFINELSSQQTMDEK